MEGCCKKGRFRTMPQFGGWLTVGCGQNVLRNAVADSVRCLARRSTAGRADERSKASYSIDRIVNGGQHIRHFSERSAPLSPVHRRR